MQIWMVIAQSSKLGSDGRGFRTFKAKLMQIVVPLLALNALLVFQTLASADEYIPCHNCTAANAKNLAKQSGLEDGSGVENVHVFDVVTGSAWSYQVTSNFEPETGASFVVAASKAVPPEVLQAVGAYKNFLIAMANQKVWSYPTQASGAANDGPISIPADVAGCVGSVISDDGSLADVSNHIRAVMTIPLANLFNLTHAPRNVLNYMMDAEPFYVAVVFADNSTATFKLDSYLTQGGYLYVQNSAHNADGSPGGGDCDGDGENDNGTGGSGGDEETGVTREGTAVGGPNETTVCRTGYVNGVRVGTYCWTYYWP